MSDKQVTVTKHDTGYNAVVYTQEKAATVHLGNDGLIDVQGSDGKYVYTGNSQEDAGNAVNRYLDD